MTTNEKLTALREKMRERNIDAYVVLSEDAHQSEYVAPHWRSREWISGFDGSAGSVAVTADRAVLWADGRYYIQASQQIAGSEFEMIKLGASDDGIPEWLAAELSRDAVVGIDGRTISVSEFEKYEAAARRAGLRFETSVDLIGEIWRERPELPGTEIFEHDIKYAGRTRAEKLGQLRAGMREKGADAYLISSLDDIAWLFNLRGGDIEYVPVFYSYAFIDMTEAYLFVADGKPGAGFRETLVAEGITLMPYNGIAEFLKGCTGNIYMDPDRIGVYLKSLIPGSAEPVMGMDITTALKAVKNETELRNIEGVQIRDGAAMVRFIKWVKDAVKTERLEEADIHDKLTELRGGEDFMGPSFGTIAAYMANAAAMHYNPVKSESAVLEPRGLLLVDSGGQYQGGTTDITRTIVLGDITDEMRQDFTLVLKSHIALATAKFLYGATGPYLDAIPRRIMWDRGMDYKCGTGHGVGYFLSVHEGPQRFRMAMDNPARIEPGMITTNEPGIYKEGEWGIRTENTLLAVDDRETADGRFMRFETISYCPIDLAGVDTGMLTADERAWLNKYHATVYSKLAPVLDSEHREWLRENTREI